MFTGASAAPIEMSLPELTFEVPPLSLDVMVMVELLAETISAPAWLGSLVGVLFLSVIRTYRIRFNREHYWLDVNKNIKLAEF